MEGGCGGGHTLKCRHVANMSHFAISAPDMSARMNDVGHRRSGGVFLLETEAEQFRQDASHLLQQHNCFPPT